VIFPVVTLEDVHSQTNPITEQTGLVRHHGAMVPGVGKYNCQLAHPLEPRDVISPWFGSMVPEVGVCRRVCMCVCVCVCVIVRRRVVESRDSQRHDSLLYKWRDSCLWAT